MKLLTNPVFLRMATVLLSSVAAFVIGVVVLRMLRRGIVEQDNIQGSAEDSVPLHTFAVIQQLKQQKFALENEHKIERQRAKTSEHIIAAMIASLPCGILFVAPNGLVRQANAAARRMLGFASPVGMSVPDLFGDSRGVSESRAEFKAAEAVSAALRGRLQFRQFESRYSTPGNEERMLKFTLIPLTHSGEMLGVAAVIGDESEMAGMRQGLLLRAETSAEMALAMRTSLTSIREWAGEIARSANSQRTQDLTADITSEAERLDKSVGRFLAGDQQAMAAGA